MTIRYISLDFDNCIFNTKYVRAPHNNFTKHLTDDVVKFNKKFLDKLAKQNRAYDEVVAFIGSTRQSMMLDRMNGGYGNNFKGSCCPAIKTITDYLGIKFDPLLMADIESEVPNGTSYNLIMDEINKGNWLEYTKWEHKHPNCGADEFKRPILFAQMQKAALEHPNDLIIFDFFDDNDSILNVLKFYFTKYPHMIPANVCLRLHKYAGEDDKLMAEIQGIGAIYAQYNKVVQVMLNNIEFIDTIAEEMAKFRTQEPVSGEKEASEPSHAETPKTKEETDPILATPIETEKQEMRNKSLDLINEIAEQGLYVKDSNSVNNYFKSNPKEYFVVRPSTTKIEGLLTIALAVKTTKGIIYSRFGFNLDGEVFFIPDSGDKKIVKVLPGGIIETFKKEAQYIINNVKNTDDLSKLITTTKKGPPKPGAEDKENKDLSIAGKRVGFFDHKQSKDHAADLHPTNGLRN